MTRYLVTLHSSRDRARAAKYLAAAPFGTRVEFKAAKRTLSQNDRFWAMLTDVSEQLSWHGKKLRADDWKLVFLDALKRELRIVPNIDGTGFVNLGRSSSDLTKSEMGDLMEIISAFGAQNGVQFHDSQTSRQPLLPPNPGAETSPAIVPDAVAGTYSTEEVI